MCRIGAKVPVAHALCSIVRCLLLRRVASVPVRAGRRSIACLALRPTQHVRGCNPLVDRAILATGVGLVSSRISRTGAPRRAAHIVVRLLAARRWVATLLRCKGLGGARDPVAVGSIVIIWLASMAGAPIIVPTTRTMAILRSRRVLAILKSRRVLAICAVIAVPTTSYVRLWTRRLIAIKLIGILSRTGFVVAAATRIATVDIRGLGISINSRFKGANGVEWPFPTASGGIRTIWIRDRVSLIVLVLNGANWSHRSRLLGGHVGRLCFIHGDRGIGFGMQTIPVLFLVGFLGNATGAALL